MGRPIKFWVNSGKRVGGSKVNLFVIKITASGIGHLVCTRLVAAGGGVCCAAPPQLVILILIITIITPDYKPSQS